MKIKRYIIFYLVLVYLGFVAGPIDWRVSNLGALTFYWFFLIGAIGLGWYAANSIVRVSMVPSPYVKKRTYKQVTWPWVLVGVVYIHYKSLQMTGIGLSDALDFVGNTTKENYTNMVRFSSERESNFLQSILVAVLSLFYWSALYLLLKNIRTKIDYLKVAILTLSYLVFVTVKGADKEILEIFLFFIMINHHVFQKIKLSNIFFGAALLISFVVFIAIRKVERSSGELCFYMYCTDTGGGSFYQGAGLLIGYVSQGLKGLATGLQMKGVQSIEFCVSPMFSSFANRFLGHCVDKGEAIAFIESSGVWTANGHWVSLPVWLSSLGSIWIVPFFMMVHAFFFSVALRFKEIHETFLGFMFVFYSVIIYIYLPANNQIFLSLDSALIFVLSYFFVVFKVFRNGWHAKKPKYFNALH